MRFGSVFGFQCFGVPSGEFFSPTLSKDCYIAFRTLFACGKMDDFTVMAAKNFKWQLWDSLVPGRQGICFSDIHGLT